MDIKQLIKEWIKRDGEIAVEKELLESGITGSTRAALIKGRHRGNPRGLLRHTLINLLKKAGLLEQGIAS